MDVRQLRRRLAAGLGLVSVFLLGLMACGAPEPVETIAIGAVVQHAALSPDGASLAIGCIDGTVRLFDTETWDLTWETQVHESTAVGCVAFLPDGSQVAGTVSDVFIVFLDATTGRERRRLEVYTAPLQENEYDENAFWGTDVIAFSPDGALVACGDRTSGHVKLVSLATGEGPIVARHRPLNGSQSLAFSPDGRLLASYGSEDTIVVNTETLEVVGTPARPGLRQDANGMTVFSPDEAWLAMTAGKSGGVGVGSTNVVLYDIETWTLKRLAIRNDGIYGSVALNSGGGLLAAGGDKLSLWDTDGFGLIAAHTIATYRRGGVVWMGFSSDSELLYVAGGTRGYLEVWRVCDLTGE